MEIKTVIAGSRKYNDYENAEKFIEECLKELLPNNKIVIISGGCKGADMLGIQYAANKGFDVIKYPAQWKKYGKAAGPVRNREMAQTADIIICFWDGNSSGTKSMIDYGKKAGKDVYIKYITP